MVEKNHLHPFLSHFRSIFGKIMRFSNHVILGSANLHGSVSASKLSIFSTLPCKCSPFPWRVFNFEILALESGISASPNFRFFSIFSQYWSSRSNLSCLNDRLYHSLHILLARHADFLIWLPSICEKTFFLFFQVRLPESMQATQYSSYKRSSNQHSSHSALKQLGTEATQHLSNLALKQLSNQATQQSSI